MVWPPTLSAVELTQQLIVGGVTAYPEPQQAFRDLDGERSIVETDSGDSLFADLFEMERWMTGIRLQ